MAKSGEVITAQSSVQQEASTHVSFSFEDAYQECFAFVWRTARRLGVPERHLDDVCQEVFVVVYRRLEEFEGRSQLKSWVYQIAVNVVRNQQRTERRKSPHVRSLGSVVDPEELNAETPGPELLASQFQAADAAREILMTMSEKKRMAFVLVDLEGLSLKEVADTTGESLHTVRSRVRAARQEFERLARRLASSELAHEQ